MITQVPTTASHLSGLSARSPRWTACGCGWAALDRARCPAPGRLRRRCTVSCSWCCSRPASAACSPGTGRRARYEHHRAAQRVALVRQRGRGQRHHDDHRPGVTGLLGPNGAGKSTMLHLIAGFLAPSRGELTVAARRAGATRGSTARSASSRSATRSTRSSPGKSSSSPRPGCTSWPIRPPRHGGPSRWWRWPRPRTGKISTYSKGMRQRIKVAAALVHDPRCCCWTSRSTGWTRGSGCT